METIKQYKGIVVSHTHWDRAWYWTFEQFRVRLIQTVDQVIDILNSNASYKSFTLDGQTVVLEDYLDVKPERRSDIERLVNGRRLFIGPWYVLPDEFLVSGESLIRNIMLGLKISKQFGHSMKEGYVPDPFGHIRQLPQILKGFDLRSFIFMRGMSEAVNDLGSEFWWEGPDGSKVVAIYQRDNYGNLACWGFPYEFGDYRYSVPNNDIAVENVRKTFDSIRTVATTPYLLFNNGIDHLPPQPQVPQLIDHVNRTLTDLKLAHGTFTDFVDAVMHSSSSSFKTYSGELIGNYHHLILLSVYSTRMYLKTANFLCQNLLERYAEPLAALTQLEAKQDYTPVVWKAWKELLKTHPHDDICGCGIDEIHRDNVSQFDHVRQIGEYVREQSMLDLSREINTAAVEGKPLLLYNPMNWDRSETVPVRILFKEGEDPAKFHIVDARGRPLPYAIRGSAPLYRMEILTEGKYTAVDIDLHVILPSCGYTTVYVKKGKVIRPQRQCSATKRGLENAFVKVSVNANGTLNIIDRLRKKSYKNLLLFEDAEDAGDEYTYSWIERGKTITTKNSRPEIRVIENSPLRGVLSIRHKMKIPESLHPNRTRRSPSAVTVDIVSTVTLCAGSSRVDVRTEVTNRAKDHRLRVLFPTDIKTDVSLAGGHFDVVERPAVTGKRPTSKNRFEFYSTRHNQDFVSLHDGKKGLTVANKGIPEYEAIHAKNGTTLAFTLLRCVGSLSRNDYITRHMQAGPQLPTPEAQCLGTYSFEYSVLPHEGPMAEDPSVHTGIFNYTAPVVHWNVDRHSGKLPNEMSVLTVESPELILSALKRAEDKSGVIVRFYNITGSPVSGIVGAYRPLLKVDRVNLNEELVSALPLVNDRSFAVSAGPREIVTLKLTFKQ